MLSVLSDLDGTALTASAPADWPALVDRCGGAIVAIGEQLFASTKSKIGASFWRETQGECVGSQGPSARIAEYRRRPTAMYYEEMGKPVPAPMNPHGSFATGLEISVSLWRATPQSNEWNPARLHLAFQCWGAQERLGFLHLLRDYRRPVASLLENGGYQFESAVRFENVARYRGHSASHRLELYAENVRDKENRFTLWRQFSAHDSVTDVHNAAVPLIILLDAVLGYSKRRRDRDRLLRYTAFMR